MSINNSNTLDINDISKILSQRAFGTMIKPIGSRCNLNCTYCYYLHRDKNHSQETSLMSEELLEEYIKQYIEAQQVDTVTFCWHGGEPTLAKDLPSFIEKIKIPARDAMQYISSCKDVLDVEYVGAKGQTAEEIKQEILEVVNTRVKDEIVTISNGNIKEYKEISFLYFS